MSLETHAIVAAVHGRYLTWSPGARPIGLLVGFHGQGETATVHMECLRASCGERPWLLVSVQGLNRYYTRSGDIVAAWMTREDRDLAIADNIAYVRAVVADVLARHGASDLPLVYCGFSQGTAMAYRAAAFAGHRSLGLVILAGDLPPDVSSHASTLPPVLLGRGLREEWYTADRAAIDLASLTQAGVPVTEHVFDDGHIWHPSFSDRVGRFLDAVGGTDGGPR